MSNQKSHSLDRQIDWDDAKTNSYMLQRWVSMLGPGAAFVENEITNRFGTEVSSDKNLMYHALSVFAPRFSKFPRYLKAGKQSEKRKTNKELDAEAEAMELTERERAMYDAALADQR